ncbi:MAG TPA: ABC transporter permease, partial [Micromonosporaceae bacterium]|nr:ABC transporter permease [Micromonosporaceae bacterium]
MTTMAHALTDSRTMLRRQLLHLRRYPSLTGLLIGMPVVFLLLFAYVFGGTLGAGIGGDRSAYVNYLTPGMLLFTMAGAAAGTAISVAMDMTEGIVARFKTMAIGRAAVLGGHVLGTLIQTGIGLVAVLAVALLVGFRPDADIVEWVAAVGLLAMIALAITWLCVACGLAAKSVETASNIPMPLMLLPFLSSGFAPTD